MLIKNGQRRNRRYFWINSTDASSFIRLEDNAALDPLMSITLAVSLFITNKRTDKDRIFKIPIPDLIRVWLKVPDRYSAIASRGTVKRTFKHP